MPRTSPATICKSDAMGESVEIGRLAELAIALSLAPDLGTNQPGAGTAGALR